MAESHSTPQPTDPTPQKPQPPRAILFGATAVLSSFVLFQAPTLWGEWQGLQRDWDTTRRYSPVGYVNITPSPSFAQKPDNWIHDEGDSTLLWSGWNNDTGHGWFRIQRNVLDVSRLHGPIGRDVIRAIDRPVVEIGGGERWERIHPDALVVGMEIHDVISVYPLPMLAKVEAINDTIAEVPVLVVMTPFVPSDEAVDIYNPVLNGERLTMGSSGYFLDKKPLLYDRKTESFWIAEGKILRAVAGPLKGATLKRIKHGHPIAWSSWQGQYPESRLIVGADRTHPLPMQ